MNNIQDWLTSDCTESALGHKVEREWLKFLCYNLFYDVVGEARKRPLGSLPAPFPVKWHFPFFLTFQPSSGLSCSLLSFWSSLKLTWPLKQMSSYLCSSSVVHGMGVVLALEGKFQAFTGNFSDGEGKGGKAMPIWASHKLGFRDRIPFLSTQPCWTWEKWAPDKLIVNPTFC